MQVTPRPSTPNTLTSLPDALREWHEGRRRDHAELRGRRWEAEVVTPEMFAESRRGLEELTEAYEVNEMLKRRQFLLVRREDGWWFLTPWEHCPECGPYNTAKEATDALNSLVKNHVSNFTPDEICTGSK